MENIVDLNEIPVDLDGEDLNISNLGERENEASTNVNSNHDEAGNEENLVEPTVGMSFVSGEDFAVFCHEYAYRKGFSFFSRTSVLLQEYKDRGVVRTSAGVNQPMYYMMERIRLHCKYGGRKQTDGSHVTGCPVYVFARMVAGKMVIHTCKLEHNHPLDPKVSRLMINFRRIDDPTTSKITNNDKAGISIAKSYNALVVESGGYENITYNQKDVRNVVHVNRRKSRFEGDVVALEKYFEQQFECNNQF